MDISKSDYQALICFVFAGICFAMILRGLITGRPPGQKGISGTGLQESRKLLYVQLSLLTLLLVCSLVTGYVFWQVDP